MAKRSERTMEEWAEHVAAWRRTGATQRAYCAEHGLTEFAFSYWKRKVEGKARGPMRARMVEVPQASIQIARPLVELRIGENLDVALQFRIPGHLMRALFQ